MEEKTRSKILIVDDSQTNTYVLTKMLAPLYKLFFASDGAMAIEAAERHLPDIILLDILMPVMNGLDVLQRLKGSETTKNIPVIFITGLDNIEDEERGLLLGAVDYITKPFHGAIVKARIKTHLRLSGYTRTIERLCMIDTLTELPNRRGFDSRMELEWVSAVRGQTPLSILLIDIDKFKNFNDSYGHAQGDLLLQTISGVFAGILRREMDFAARWGGEEFAVLLPGTALNEAIYAAEQIRNAIELMTIACAGGEAASVTVSIGVCTKTPDESSTAAELFSLADKALYNAKNSGRNRTCWL